MPVGSKSTESGTFLTGVDISEQEPQPQVRKTKPQKRTKVELDDNNWLDELRAMHSSINMCFGEDDSDADRGFFKEARQWEEEVARIVEEHDQADIVESGDDSL